MRIKEPCTKLVDSLQKIKQIKRPGSTDRKKCINGTVSIIFKINLTKNFADIASRLGETKHSKYGTHIVPILIHFLLHV